MTISAQAASIIVQARLVESLKNKERERKEYQKRMIDAMRKLRSYEGRRREKHGENPTTLARPSWSGLRHRRDLVGARLLFLNPRMDLSAIQRKNALAIRNVKSKDFAARWSGASSKSTSLKIE